jgi:hypothetical protein
MDQPAFARPRAPDAAPEPPAAPCDPVLRLIGPEVDAAFYLAANPDVAAAGIEAADHYWRMGWREGRDPSPWFRTGFYLAANPDVAAAGINPLWHYLVRGREEGRTPREPGGPWREELDRPPPLPTPVATGARRLGPASLRRLLTQATAGARGLVLAVSHDRYIDIAGGTQLLIADEQRKVNSDCGTYLHLSPTVARLGLAPADAAPEWLGVTLDGTWRGIARRDALAPALAGLPADLPRLLVVHALHGWRPESVAALAAALRPAHAVFWAHDYGAACGNPRLLRNDIAPCGAPPPASLGCRICRYGDERPTHLARLQALFRAVPMRVVAPSAIAADIWGRAAALPAVAVHVHPHARLHPQPAATEAEAGPVRLGFIGGADYHKGWGLFRDLLGHARGRNDRQFHQFATPDLLRPMDGLIQVPARTDATAPHGMTRALAAHRIDLVLALSPWAETFSYAAHEALAAGADLVALESGGNVAALVRDLGRGVVLADAAAVAAFVLGDAADAHVARRRAAGRQTAWLDHCGSTATLAPDGDAATTAEPDLHLLFDCRRIEGVRSGTGWRFTLPPNASPKRLVRLRSRHVAAAWRADLADDRRLGVAVTALALDGRPVGPERLRSGWHAAEPGLRWTDGDAAIMVGAARVLEVQTLPLLRYGRVPMFAPVAA